MVIKIHKNQSRMGNDIKGKKIYISNEVTIWWVLITSIAINPFCDFARNPFPELKSVFALAQCPGQVKLDSDKWKLWKNLFE